MTVDTYALCPCGSGKKIKFCKCNDSIADLDRILKMVNGGQLVAALDRLNQVLKEHPAAAWALAIKGRLLLDLREYDSLEQNAERFIRLQPSNPLALTQRAAAHVFRGQLSEATASLLEGLTEAGQNVDSFILDVASVLAVALAQSGVVLTSRVYATLSLTARGYQGGNTAEMVLDELNGSRNLNQLLKTVPSLRKRPADAAWGERYDEAAGLLRSNQILLADSKLQSLERQFPGQPAILSGLLMCAIWRGDAAAQSDTLRKLSECASLDFEERARLLAMSALVQPEQEAISIEMLEWEVPLEDAAQAEMALAASSRTVPMPAEMIRAVAEQSGQVPPRSGYQIIDRDKPDLESLPSADEVPETIATVLVFGRQTDRPPRIEVMEVRTQDRDTVTQALADATNGAEAGEVSSSPLPLIAAVQPSVPMLRFKATQAAANKLQLDLLRSRLVQRVLGLALPLTGNRPLRETVDDDALRLQRTAVVRILEQYDTLAADATEALAQLREALKVETLPPIKADPERMEELRNYDLGRVDVSELPIEPLVFLLQRARQISCTPAVRSASRRLIELDPAGELKQAKLMAYMAAIDATDDLEESLALLDEAKAWAQQADVSDAPLLLAEVGRRLATGDAEGFRRAIQTLTAKHSQDPAAMAQLQQMLVAYGLVNPDGSPRAARPAAAAGAAPAAAGAGGGLWTPGSAAPPPPAAAPSPEPSAGGSKLWIPGMD